MNLIKVPYLTRAWILKFSQGSIIFCGCGLYNFLQGSERSQSYMLRVWIWNLNKCSISFTCIDLENLRSHICHGYGFGTSLKFPHFLRVQILNLSLGSLSLRKRVREPFSMFHIFYGYGYGTLITWNNIF